MSCSAREAASGSVGAAARPASARIAIAETWWATVSCRSRARSTRSALRTRSSSRWRDVARVAHRHRHRHRRGKNAEAAHRVLPRAAGAEHGEHRGGHHQGEPDDRVAPRCPPSDGVRQQQHEDTGVRRLARRVHDPRHDLEHRERREHDDEDRERPGPAPHQEHARKQGERHRARGQQQVGAQQHLEQQADGPDAGDRHVARARRRRVRRRRLREHGSQQASGSGHAASLGSPPPDHSRRTAERRLHRSAEAGSGHTTDAARGPPDERGHRRQTHPPGGPRCPTSSTVGGASPPATPGA